MPGVAIGVDRWRRHHEVSILIAAGGVGRCFGSRQRAGLFERGFRRLGLFWARRQGEQLARVRNVFGSVAIGEQPIVSDAMEALRQHVDQEAPDELVSRQRHRLVAGGPLDPIVLVLEGDAVLVGGPRTSEILGRSSPRYPRPLSRPSSGQWIGRTLRSRTSPRRRWLAVNGVRRPRGPMPMIS